MIRYDGTKNPCFFQRLIIPCMRLATFRVTGPHHIMHVCEDHLQHAREACTPIEEEIKLTGDDSIDAIVLDPAGLLRDAPWVKEIDGLTREALDGTDTK